MNNAMRDITSFTENSSKLMKKKQWIQKVKVQNITRFENTQSTQKTFSWKLMKINSEEVVRIPSRKNLNKNSQYFQNLLQEL